MISFRFLGLIIKISVGFLGALSFMLYIDKTGMMLLTLKATFFHELGHLITMCCYGYKPQKIELRIGAFLLCGRFDYSIKKELFIALSGPLANLILSAVCFVLYYFYGFKTLTEALVMLVMGAFHLLPISELDGGTVLKCILTRLFSQKTALILQKAVSLILIFCLLALGVFVFITTKNNPSLILLGFYLLFCLFFSNNKKQGLQSFRK